MNIFEQLFLSSYGKFPYSAVVLDLNGAKRNSYGFKKPTQVLIPMQLHRVYIRLPAKPRERIVTDRYESESTWLHRVYLGLDWLFALLAYNPANV